MYFRETAPLIAFPESCEERPIDVEAAQFSSSHSRMETASPLRRYSIRIMIFKITLVLMVAIIGWAKLIYSPGVRAKLEHISGQEKVQEWQGFNGWDKVTNNVQKHATAAIDDAQKQASIAVDDAHKQVADKMGGAKATDDVAQDSVLTSLSVAVAEAKKQGNAAIDAAMDSASTKLEHMSRKSVLQEWNVDGPQEQADVSFGDARKQADIAMTDAQKQAATVKEQANAEIKEKMHPAKAKLEQVSNEGIAQKWGFDDLKKQASGAVVDTQHQVNSAVAGAQVQAAKGKSQASTAIEGIADSANSKLEKGSQQGILQKWVLDDLNNQANNAYAVAKKEPTNAARHGTTAQEQVNAAVSEVADSVKANIGQVSEQSIVQKWGVEDLNKHSSVAVADAQHQASSAVAGARAQARNAEKQARAAKENVADSASSKPEQVSLQGIVQQWGLDDLNNRANDLYADAKKEATDAAKQVNDAQEQASPASNTVTGSDKAKLGQVSNQDIAQKWSLDDSKKQAVHAVADTQNQANSVVTHAKVRAAGTKKQANSAMEDAADSANSKLEQVSQQGIVAEWGFKDLNNQANDAYAGAKKDATNAAKQATGAQDQSNAAVNEVIDSTKAKLEQISSQNLVQKWGSDDFFKQAGDIVADTKFQANSKSAEVNKQAAEVKEHAAEVKKQANAAMEDAADSANSKLEQVSSQGIVQEWGLNDLHHHADAAYADAKKEAAHAAKQASDSQKQANAAVNEVTDSANAKLEQVSTQGSVQKWGFDDFKRQAGGVVADAQHQANSAVASAQVQAAEVKKQANAVMEDAADSANSKLGQVSPQGIVQEWGLNDMHHHADAAYADAKEDPTNTVKPMSLVPEQANVAVSEATVSAEATPQQVSNQVIVQKWGFDDFNKGAGGVVADAQNQANSAVAIAQLDAAEVKKQASAAMEDAADSANSKLEQVAQQGVVQEWGLNDLSKRAFSAYADAKKEATTAAATDAQDQATAASNEVTDAARAKLEQVSNQGIVQKWGFDDFKQQAGGAVADAQHQANSAVASAQVQAAEVEKQANTAKRDAADSGNSKLEQVSQQGIVKEWGLKDLSNQAYGAYAHAKKGATSAAYHASAVQERAKTAANEVADSAEAKLKKLSAQGIAQKWSSTDLKKQADGMVADTQNQASSAMAGAQVQAAKVKEQAGAAMEDAADSVKFKLEQVSRQGVVQEWGLNELSNQADAAHADAKKEATHAAKQASDSQEQANAAANEATDSANAKLEQAPNQGIVQKWGFDDFKQQAGGAVADAHHQANSAVASAQVQAAEVKKQANAAMEDAADSANSKLEQVSQQGVVQEWGLNGLSNQADAAYADAKKEAANSAKQAFDAQDQAHAAFSEVTDSANAKLEQVSNEGIVQKWGFDDFRKEAGRNVADPQHQASEAKK